MLIDAQVQRESPAWARRLGEVCEALRVPLAPKAREDIRTEAWLLLTTALLSALKLQSSRVARAPAEALEDIASQKSLELLLRAESGAWRPESRHPLEIVAFLSTIARNELVSRWRHEQRHSPLPEQAGGSLATDAAQDAMEIPSRIDASAHAEAREFAAALAACALNLQPRARLAWFLRVFHELPSKQIAAHPGVGLTVPNVNVVLQRARDSVRQCMKAKGFDVRTMPIGTFTHLWMLLHPSSRDGSGGDHGF